MIEALLLLLLGAPQRPVVEWREDEIWLTREGSPPAQLTRDGCEKGRQPAWSPDQATGAPGDPCRPAVLARNAIFRDTEVTCG